MYVMQGRSEREMLGLTHPSPMSRLSEIVGTVEVLSAKFYFGRITWENI